MSVLNVFWNNVLVGRLVQTNRRDFSFQYHPDYLQRPEACPISLSLPLQDNPHGPEISRAWFANLLPEGEILAHVARRLGVSERNDFAILEGIGGDCAGALQLLKEEAIPDVSSQLIPLSWTDLERKLATVDRPSLLALVMQNGELRLSLAGAQDKLPVHLSGDELYLPAGNTASTHLLKVSSRAFSGLVENEMYCMRLAEAVGLPVAPVTMAPTRTPILVVERYDRQVGAEGVIQRLHQEDFCQALGQPPELKYQNEGGPSLAEMFSMLKHGSQSPLPDKRVLLQWVLFNFICGNADAHAKNASFLVGLPDDGVRPHLAPFYDLVCTAVYPSLSAKLAQKLGGEYRPRNVGSRHWDRLAESIAVQPRYLRRVGLELCARVEENAGPLRAKLGTAYSCEEILDRIGQVIEQRMGWIRKNLEG